MIDKVAIITGASSGIGHATATMLAKNGITVMLAARREDRLQQLRDEIVNNGGKASYKVTDVTSYDQMKELVDKTLHHFGKVDVLINNAGIMPISYMRKLKVDDWNRMIDVNIKGVLHGIAAVLPTMQERNEGHIINISSVAGYEVYPPRVLYSATKHAVRIITEGLRKELLPEENIRTTLISPGSVDTELVDSVKDEDVLNMIREEGSLDRTISSDDIANAILYAIRQPSAVSVNDIIIRPTAQRR
ncbi:SDR family oxidoreductase [Siminovitchia acidinfaciens]|uniref:SDR family oxidoreductase n=1 Tax=Siminovitchia acidinfaciens TaxID=2321395 RepID=A0A429XZC1_9BACI|nr:SDR family oxidoreductase [Siminovitchia acidinfaciens]RST74145.1 SDR family oxidoreductase [Siminovitchia acidinfaciens]